jgi:hypothetical protein
MAVSPVLLMKLSRDCCIMISAELKIKGNDREQAYRFVF